MARDRPSPYDEGRGFVLSVVCARFAPPSVVCDRLILTYRGEEIWQQNDGEGNPLGCACGIRGPSPYGEGS